MAGLFDMLIAKKKKPEAAQGGGGGSRYGEGAVEAKGEDFTEDEVREMGRSYLGQAPGREPELSKWRKLAQALRMKRQAAGTK